MWEKISVQQAQGKPQLRFSFQPSSSLSHEFLGSHKQTVVAAELDWFGQPSLWFICEVREFWEAEKLGES